MAPQARLLLIDPQNDFCDLPSPARPALPVVGAHADMLRVAQLIRQLEGRLERIGITLDSHHRVDIAHPPFWRTADGGPVSPFTQISAASVKAGQFVPRDRNLQERVLGYLDELEARGRYTLMVWPVHCEIGTWGHNVHDAVQAASQAWQEQRGTNVDYFFKGQNPWTEHYSAAMAEVPLVDDPSTQLNRDLVDWANGAEWLLVAGEASSHCVRATVLDILEHLTPRSAEHFKRVVLLTDCTSPVQGFETQASEFLRMFEQQGGTLATSESVSALLT